MQAFFKSQQVFGWTQHGTNWLANKIKKWVVFNSFFYVFLIFYVKIFAKIENAEGVKNAKSILDECDGLLIARGDLGVEIPLEKLPIIQKKLISLCNVSQKCAIVATEMLESMVSSSRPTRAEVNDVANAIYDEANATMLSAETSIGKNPILAVKTMKNIIFEVEKVMYNTVDI